MPSWMTAASPSRMAAVTTPWPPEPEKTMRVLIAVPPPWPGHDLVVGLAVFGPLSLDKDPPGDEPGVFGQTPGAELGGRAVLHQHLGGLAELVLAAEIGRALAEDLHHREPLVGDGPGEQIDGLVHVVVVRAMTKLALRPGPARPRRNRRCSGTARWWPGCPGRIARTGRRSCRRWLFMTMAVRSMLRRAAWMNRLPMARASPSPIWARSPSARACSA